MLGNPHGLPSRKQPRGKLTTPATPAAPLPLQVLAAEAEAKHPLWDIRTHADAEQFWQRVRCMGVRALRGRHYSGRAASCELPGLPHALRVQHVVASACRVAVLHGTHRPLLRRPPPAQEFGHLSGEQPADAADGAHHTAGKATLV